MAETDDGDSNDLETSHSGHLHSDNVAGVNMLRLGQKELLAIGMVCFTICFIAFFKRAQDLQPSVSVVPAPESVEDIPEVGTADDGSVIYLEPASDGEEAMIREQQYRDQIRKLAAKLLTTKEALEVAYEKVERLENRLMTPGMALQLMDSDPDRVIRVVHVQQEARNTQWIEAWKKLLFENRPDIAEAIEQQKKPTLPAEVTEGLLISPAGTSSPPISPKKKKQETGEEVEESESDN